jgi:glutamate formiminotransferase
MKQIVQCVPNFSEGRRQEIIDQIVAAVQSVADILILDIASDTDHNRSIITFVGEPAQVEEAAFRSVARAAALIDMTQHKGEHPRMGAADVVPFVPIRGVTMADCVTSARRLGQRVGAELDIPVYLYEEAATRETLRNLADVRRGEYEVIREEIATVEGRRPDFGPRRLGTAGAVAIGARAALIAFNVYLNTASVEIARAVARAIRHSSGGLRYCKALGLLVEGRAQISMNLTNFQQTPMLRVLDLIRAEAAKWGCTIVESEVIGLIPQEALLHAATAALQLHDFKPGQVLENRIAGL